MASVVWPALMGATVWERLEGRRPVWTMVVYAAASRICHQRPERSFHTGGVQWPVCARCTGLYASAPLGGIAAAWVGRRRRLRSASSDPRGAPPSDAVASVLEEASARSSIESSLGGPGRGLARRPDSPRPLQRDRRVGGARALRQPWALVAIASLPTVASLAIEWTGLVEPGNFARTLAALPLGMAIAFVLVQTAAGSPKTDRVH